MVTTMHAGERTQRAHRLRIQAREHDRPCYVPGCGVTAIGSHLLQQNGMLSRIAVDHRVVELTEDNLHEDTRFSDPVHIGEAFTFLGFCSRHDHELFREVEVGPIDFDARRTRLLFSYRGFLNELQKMENNATWFRLILVDEELAAAFPNACALPALISRWDDRASARRRVKTAFEAELGIASASPPSNGYTFSFDVFPMPRIEVCTSATYNTPDDGRHQNGIDQPARFINILPMPDRTQVVLGCYGPRTLDPSEGELRRLISDMLIQRIETWACSPAWFDSYLHPHRDRVLAEIARLRLPEMKRETPTLNLFELAT